MDKRLSLKSLYCIQEVFQWVDTCTFFGNTHFISFLLMSHDRLILFKIYKLNSKKKKNHFSLQPMGLVSLSFGVYMVVLLLVYSAWLPMFRRPHLLTIIGFLAWDWHNTVPFILCDSISAFPPCSWVLVKTYPHLAKRDKHQMYVDQIRMLK